MSNARILIVEDEGIEALDIQRRLISLGYPSPDIVFSGEDAVTKAEETRPDLILMDIMLAGQIDGVKAAESIHAKVDVPVIYLTAYTDEDTLKRAKITEPYGYIVKPFKDREVHITIDMALYKHGMERRLKEREKWFSTTLKSVGDAVIATDKNGLVTFMNGVAEDLVGLKEADVVNHRLAETLNIVNGKTRQPVENAVSKVILEGSTVDLAGHTILIARDGREVPIDEKAAPIKDDKGNIMGAILVFRDVTERQKAEEDLRRANDELEQRVSLRTADLALANKNLKQEVEQRKKAEYRLEEKNIELENAGLAKDRFLGSMTHELTMILSVIVGYSDRLRLRVSGPMSEGQERQLASIHSSAQHLQSLIYYLLDLVRIESGQVTLSTEPIDVVGLIREVVEAMKPQAEQKGLRFTCNLPPGEVVMRTHRRALSQILLNLTGNAIKYTSRGAVGLEFGQRYHSGRLMTEIIVVDTGMGIKEEDQGKLFDAATYLDEDRLYTGRVAGLGLHLSQKLAELLGGEISFKSIYGEGSTFTLTLKPFRPDLKFFALPPKGN
ncbi:MAG: PAS domain S-box protein [Chloroflexi bacterium]|nr:PAS domain S-box protein [Chloroflexota bacterium]